MAYEKRMQNYPLFISYSRTGCHWINCVMELYFNRPRLREQRVTLLDKNRKDYMWFHDHDYELDVQPHQNVLYLYRDPIPTVYSNLMYKRFENRKDKKAYEDIKFDHESVLVETSRYNKNLRKWLLGNFKARTFVKHENFKTNKISEFSKIIKHFGGNIDENKINKIFDSVTKEKILNAEQVYAPAMNQELLSEHYSKNRDIFSDEWGSIIKKIILTDDIKQFFK